MPLDADEVAFIADLEEREFNCEIQNELVLYRSTGDARFVWKAIMLFAEAGKTLPVEFIAKLAEWGGMIQHLSAPEEITAALDLTGEKRQPVGPKHSEAYRLRWRLASEVQMVHKVKGGTLLGAFTVVARNRGLSAAVVKKAYHSVFTAPAKSNRSTGATQLSDALKNWR
jgi:hypothetical protein